MTSTAPVFRPYDRVKIHDGPDGPLITVTITKRLFSTDQYLANGHGQNWTLNPDDIKGLA